MNPRDAAPAALSPAAAPAARPATGACLASEPLSGFAARREAVLAESFSAGERAALRDRPHRSVAGRLALKHALADLWRRALPGVRAELSDFTLETDDVGRPVLAAAPGPASLRAAVRVSLSHSRATAWGLAAGPAGEGLP